MAETKSRVHSRKAAGLSKPKKNRQRITLNIHFGAGAGV
jgi:hypothetical protein